MAVALLQCNFGWGKYRTSEFQAAPFQNRKLYTLHLVLSSELAQNTNCYLEQQTDLERPVRGHSYSDPGSGTPPFLSPRLQRPRALRGAESVDMRQLRKRPRQRGR